MKEVLKVPATVTKVTTMADGSLRLQVDTQELNSEDKGKVMDFHEKLGIFIFSEEGIELEDLKDLPKVELEEGEKQPSVRLRAVLYVYWEQNKIKEPFDMFYKKKVEGFINAIKDKLI